MAEVLVLHMTASGTSDAAATIDIPEDGDIIGVHANIAPLDLDSSGDVYKSELSFIATGQHDTNDARGVIASLRAVGLVEGTPASAVNAAMSQYLWFGPDGIRVAGGERLVINNNVSAGVTGTCVYDIYLRTRGKAPRRSARRRA